MSQLLGLTGDLLPGVRPDGVPAPQRMRSRGEAPEAWMLDRAVPASAGMYFTASNPTLGTPLTWMGASRQTFSATAVSIVWSNYAQDSTASALAPRIFPEYIRLVTATAGTSATDFQMAITEDNTHRWASGGTLLKVASTSAPPGPGATPWGSVSGIHAGNVTAAAASGSVKNVGRANLKYGTNIAAADEFILTFGSQPSQGSTDLKVVTATVRQIDFGPFAIAPGGSLVFSFWSTSITTSHSFEVEASWYEG